MVLDVKYRRDVCPMYLKHSNIRRRKLARPISGKYSWRSPAEDKIQRVSGQNNASGQAGGVFFKPSPGKARNTQKFLGYCRENARIIRKSQV